MPRVSVIIPCYNLGQYVHEAIDSVLAQSFQDFEIIVVDDGSTDLETKRILNALDDSHIKLIATENQGLASARNNGIAQAKGDYILPLDADDKIAPTYLEKAVNVFDRNENIGIVYCLAEFFGEENFKWDLPDYALSRILIDNLIFAASFFRREDWLIVGGYKPTMIYGWEDYEFWLSIIELKRGVYRLPEYLFYYRKRRDSMAHVMSREQVLYSYKEIVKNHRNLYIDNIQYVFEHIYSLREKIAGNQEELIAKDTQIHNLNLQMMALNKDLSEMKAQISNGRNLMRLLFNFAARKLHFKS